MAAVIPCRTPRTRWPTTETMMMTSPAATRMTIPSRTIGVGRSHGRSRNGPSLIVQGGGGRPQLFNIVMVRFVMGRILFCGISGEGEMSLYRFPAASVRRRDETSTHRRGGGANAQHIGPQTWSDVC